MGGKEDMEAVVASASVAGWVEGTYGGEAPKLDCRRTQLRWGCFCFCDSSYLRRYLPVGTPRKKYWGEPVGRNLKG